MDENANSWLRRTNFSHTVYHRLDSTRLAATAPFTAQRKDELPELKSRAVSTSVIDQNPKPQVKARPVRQMSAPSASKQRSLSPSPFQCSTILETFKEAESRSVSASVPDQNPKPQVKTRPVRQMSAPSPSKQRSLSPSPFSLSTILETFKEAESRSVSTSVPDQNPKPQVKTRPVRQMSAPSPSKQRSLSPSPFSLSTILETFKEAESRSVSTSVPDQNPKPRVKTGPVRQMSTPTPSKQRSLSPSPFSTISETFKEAQLDKKRFSTPHSRRTESMGELLRKNSHQSKMVTSHSSSQLNTSTSLTNFSSMKLHEITKSKKESAWTKYFDHGGGKVNAVETTDECMADPSQLYFGQRFAHGAHSQIYHGSYKEEPVAVKIIRVPDDDENGAMRVRLENQFKREINLLSRLHHPNIIKFVAWWRKPQVFCIITEYLSEGSLRAYLHKLDHKALDLQKVIGIALDIARGMEFIHSQGVIHRDLKPENILIDPEFHMKIADFGIACEESYCDSLTDDPGTYRWMAPEMMKIKGKGKPSYGRKVDVYSFGLILYEMVTGTIPYEDLAPFQAAFAVLYKKLRPAIPVNCAPAMRAFIEQCWCVKAEKRPEFWQVVKVLEQFESSLANDGTLTLVKDHPVCQDHKKGLLHWIHKIGTEHPNGIGGGGTIVPKPKFT